MARISWDTSQVRTLAVDLSKAPVTAQRKATLVIAKGAHDIEVDGKIFCPVDTGFLRSSISADIGALEAVIGPTADYGLYVELGVPHSYIIRAHDGGMLRFTVNGHVVFAKQVTHPPSAPHPFMAPAGDKNFPGIERAMALIAEEIL